MPVSSQQEKINELKKEYDLDDSDFWALPQNKRLRILHHDACEKIASKAGVRYEKPEWLSRGEAGVWAVQASGYIPNESDDPENILWTTGEASKDNCTAKYLVNMAEKRAKDRLVLKLIKAYEYGIKSEEEADNFKEPEPVEKPSSEPKETEPKKKVSSNGNAPAKSYPPDIPKENWGLLDKIGEARVALKSEGNVVRNTAIVLFEDKFDSDFSPKDIAKFASSDLESLLKEMQKMVAEQERD